MIGVFSPERFPGSRNRSNGAPRDATVREERRSVPLFLLFAGAIAVRVLWLICKPDAPIEMDGAEYARMAENLRLGHGIIGIRGDAQPVFSPFYPFLIAVFSFVFPTLESAATCISVLAGAALVFPLYGIASLLYGRRAGMIAGALGASLPFLVFLSAQVLSESLYLFLWISGLWALLLALERFSESGDCRSAILTAATAGALLACAYLTRPEGLAFLVIGLLALSLARRSRGVPAFTAIVLVCISPYMVYQYHQTGHFQFEAKAALNYTTGERLARGMSYQEAADEVLPDLTVVGPELMPTSARLDDPTFGERVRFAGGALRAHFGTMMSLLLGRSCGWIVLFGLAIWGALSGPWTRERIASEALLWSFLLAVIAASGTVWHFWSRYDTPFTVFLILWSARGIAALAPRFSRGYAVCAAALAVLFTSSYITQSRLPSSAVERDAGLWLLNVDKPAARSSPPKIMEVTDVVSYYADGIWRPLPYADEKTALRYIAWVDPKYVVVCGKDYAMRPYLLKWVTRGVREPGFAQILGLHPGRWDALRLYRYTRPAIIGAPFIFPIPKNSSYR